MHAALSGQYRACDQPKKHDFKRPLPELFQTFPSGVAEEIVDKIATRASRLYEQEREYPKPILPRWTRHARVRP